MRQLGLTHSTLVSSLFYKILGIDKRFQGKDPNWADVVQVGKMILIYAASHSQPDLLKDAPQPVLQSLNYLMDEYAQYFKAPEGLKRKVSINLMVRDDSSDDFEKLLVTIGDLISRGQLK